jgi:hypothetical protein
VDNKLTIDLADKAPHIPLEPDHTLIQLKNEKQQQKSSWIGLNNIYLKTFFQQYKSIILNNYVIHRFTTA